LSFALPALGIAAALDGGHETFPFVHPRLDGRVETDFPATLGVIVPPRGGESKRRIRGARALRRCGRHEQTGCSEHGRACKPTGTANDFVMHNRISLVV
jgi:hypothetical protein